jgi:hypothetical protein
MRGKANNKMGAVPPPIIPIFGEYVIPMTTSTIIKFNGFPGEFFDNDETEEESDFKTFDYLGQIKTK